MEKSWYVFKSIQKVFSSKAIGSRIHENISNKKDAMKLMKSYPEEKGVIYWVDFDWK